MAWAGREVERHGETGRGEMKAREVSKRWRDMERRDGLRQEQGRLLFLLLLLLEGYGESGLVEAMVREVSRKVERQGEAGRGEAIERKVSRMMQERDESLSEAGE